MKGLPHIAIAASAGSGKTFQLAHRYMALLARGVSADRIVALTFSRKAAGEIFDAVIEHLRQAATGEAQARATADRMDMAGLQAADFLRLLRGLLDLLPRVHVGTLDSFAVGIVRAFPLELGITTEPDLMDNEGASAQAVQRGVLRTILGGRSVSTEMQGHFYEAFKQATFGREEKGLERNLIDFVRRFLKWYRLLPEARGWGNESLLWPAGRPWPMGAGDPQAWAEEVLDLLEPVELHATLRKAIERFVAFAGAYSEHAVWDEKALDNRFGEIVLSGLPELGHGPLLLPYNRREFRLPPRVGELLRLLLEHVLGAELTRCLEETRGLYQVLQQYEGVYDERLLARGQITFDDIYYLLSPARGVVSRLDIDYRLDSRLDHWLLDEFQDTSDLQWAALGNLADEVLQDTSGERSFFYVGDVKQAIYGWRGGNARLFDQLAARYGDRIERRPLHASYRSGAEVMAAVNQVFSELPADLPRETAERWQTHWATHEVAPGRAVAPGYVALLEPRAPDGDKPDASDRYHAVACLLRDLQPLERGLTAAVLVRTNEAARELVDQLRAECPGLTVVHEGVAPLRDNPVVSVLLSLVQWAAHPGDTLAWRHVQMSPLGRGAVRADLGTRVLREIQEEGFAALFKSAGARLKSAGALDDYGQLRLHDLLEAAGEFDRAGDRDVNAFLDFMDGYTRHEVASSAAVRVMTVHQAKGLGFDVVILPELNDGSLVHADQVDFRVERDGSTGDPQWALRMPRKLVAERDEVLALQLAKADAEASFEALCVLYVAMTRAARALYLVTSFPGSSSKAVTPAAYLKARLAGPPREVVIQGEAFDVLYEEGARAWYRETLPERPAPAAKRKASVRRKRGSAAVRHRLLDVSPSRRAEHDRSGDLVFARQTRRSLGLGSGLHALFERVGWLEQTDVEQAVADWSAEVELGEEERSVALRQFRACLAAPEIRSLLACPGPGAALWREKRFDVVIEKEWITGTLDRVVVEPDRALILDYKSNEIENDDHLRQVALGYLPQMALYRRAVARMVGWTEERVGIKLIFTQPARVFDLSAIPAT